MSKDSKHSKDEWTGPQGTILFRADELAEVIASPSADSSGDVDRAALLGSTPPFLDQRFVLRGSKTTIGRREDNDIVLPDDSVSAQHAWVINDGGRFRVMNILSTNGIYINDAKVHEGPLKNGDRVRFGRAEFVFHGGAGGRRHRRNGAIPLWVWALSAALLGAAALMLVAL
ncbi:FHA domain-containing protein [Pseudothauera lacus]|uniref:Phosphopeptide-binding protein n=1 Tax=Pseudothauera lacus TaxID=2136175 RepID=A0A2T4ID19_9RHOO|nr:FHA domain-containing protein [Pseudothauera lacus]PTD95669.1 phosphopeptide-binding protein [Pseudothauera lacus]